VQANPHVRVYLGSRPPVPATARLLSPGQAASEYQVEPLEALFVGEAMQADVRTVAPGEPAAGLVRRLRATPAGRRQRLYPVVGDDGTLLGVVTPSDLAAQADITAEADDSAPVTSAGSPAADGLAARLDGSVARVIDVARTDVIVACPDETLRTAADRMAGHWLGALPVVTRGTRRRLTRILTEFDLLKARQRQLIEERHRERVLRFGRAAPLGLAGRAEVRAAGGAEADAGSPGRRQLHSHPGQPAQCQTGAVIVVQEPGGVGDLIGELPGHLLYEIASTLGEPL
jgi:CBS domain-containing protein